MKHEPTHRIVKGQRVDLTVKEIADIKAFEDANPNEPTHRMLDGVRIDYTTEEKAEIKKDWADNAAKPPVVFETIDEKIKRIIREEKGK